MDRSDDLAPELTEGVITSLAAQRKRPERVSVFIDGAFAWGVHQDLVLEFGLRKGLRMTVQQQEAVLARERLGRAKGVALTYLAYRPRTEQEVRRKLAQKGYDGDVVEQVVERLYELRYLDDEAFARQFVRERYRAKGYGPDRLRNELRRRGVAAGAVEAAIGELLEAEDPVERAREQAERRWARLASEPDPRRRKKKLSDFLRRRGFTYDTIRRVLDELDG